MQTFSPFPPFSRHPNKKRNQNQRFSKKKIKNEENKPPELLDGGEGIDRANGVSPSSLLVLGGGAIEPERP